MKKFKVYSAAWCHMCKALHKSLEKTDLPVEYIDVEDISEDELTDIGIRNLPLTILLDANGAEIKRWSGVISVNILKEAYNA